MLQATATGCRLQLQSTSYRLSQRLSPATILLLQCLLEAQHRQPISFQRSFLFCKFRNADMGVRHTILTEPLRASSIPQGESFVLPIYAFAKYIFNTSVATHRYSSCLQTRNRRLGTETSAMTSRRPLLDPDILPLGSYCSRMSCYHDAFSSRQQRALLGVFPSQFCCP